MIERSLPPCLSNLPNFDSITSIIEQVKNADEVLPVPLLNSRIVVAVHDRTSQHCNDQCASFTILIAAASCVDFTIVSLNGAVCDRQQQWSLGNRYSEGSGGCWTALKWLKRSFSARSSYFSPLHHAVRTKHLSLMRCYAAQTFCD